MMGNKRESRTRSSSSSGSTRRRRPRFMEGLREIDSRDIDLLRKCTSEHGKITPARFLGTTPKQQRRIARAIRRARVMGLLK